MVPPEFAVSTGSLDPVVTRTGALPRHTQHSLEMPDSLHLIGVPLQSTKLLMLLKCNTGLM